MAQAGTTRTDHGALLQRCAQGDRAALQALFAAEAPRMKGVARRMTRRDDLADDAVQEAFVRIWRKAGQYDPARGSALGWIYAVQRSTVLNMIRSTRREDVTDPADIDDAIERETEQRTADEIWGRMSTSSRLHTCLSDMDPARRNVVLLAYAFGLTHGELAGRMALPLGTVKSWVRRGLLSLRECMA